VPKLAPKTQAARRDRILDAAENCFIRAGFHATTMHDICREADISPGALYTYFVSKDALIIGLCEREKERFAGDLARLASAPDFISALQAMAEQFCCHEPREKLRLHLEIAAEASRNPAIGDTVRNIDKSVRSGFAELLEKEKASGRINPRFPIETVVRAMSVIGDGLFWHRAVEADFDPNPIIPVMMAMISTLLEPASNYETNEKEGVSRI